MFYKLVALNDMRANKIYDQAVINKASLTRYSHFKSAVKCNDKYYASKFLFSYMVKLKSYTAHN